MTAPSVHYEPARAVWRSLLEDQIALLTTNYIVSETMTLLQYRIGFEAARVWYRDILGMMEVLWVDETTHR